MSAKVVQRNSSRWTSRSLRAPRLSSRSVSVSKVSLMTSRCRRFLTVFGSGTLLNVIRGPLASPSPGSRTACSEVESSATLRPRTSAQNRARAGASAQSKVTAKSELVMTDFSLSRAAPGSDGGAAAVGGDDRAGDVAGFRGGEEGDDPGDLAGLGGPGQQGRGAEGRDAVGGGPVGQDRPGSDGVDPDA